MKKLLLALLLLFTGIATANAQSDDNIRSNIFDYLYERGYNVGYDKDDDIVFTKDDDLTYYFVRVSSAEDCLIVSIRHHLESDWTYDDLVQVANEFNRRQYLSKCSAQPGRFQISIEFVTSSVAQAILQTRRALFWISDCISSLNGEI